MTTFTIGARASRLALYQAHLVKGYIEAEDSSLQIKIVPIQTEADKVPDAAIANMGGKGIFVKEIESALLEKRIDLAVHSLKDMPAILPPGLLLACYLSRTDPRDMLVSRQGQIPETLSPGAVVATSSPRRAAWIKHMRPDVHIVGIRGNVETRIKKISEGVADATFLAAAGVKRLGLWDEYSRMMRPLPLTDCIPAAGQGIIVVETRIEDNRLTNALKTINSYESYVAAICERAFQKQFGVGSCNMPLGAYCSVTGGEAILYAFSASLDGKYLLRYTDRAPAGDAGKLGVAVGRTLRNATENTINLRSAPKGGVND